MVSTVGAVFITIGAVLLVFALELFLIWLINYIPYKREKKRQERMYELRCRQSEQLLRMKEQTLDEEKTNEIRNQK